jgi:protoporphyrinogen oxidase
VISTTIGILGGGLTGLTLGSLLQEAEVLEKESAVGGLCRSKMIEGFTYDIGGSHVLFSRNKDTMKFIEDKLGDNIEKRDRNTKVFFKGRYVKYPFENALSELPPEDTFECLSGYIESYYARIDESVPRPTNFEEWMYYRFGKGITEKYLLPYNEKIWKMKASEMSLDWIAGRIPDPPLDDVIKSSLGISTEGYTHQLHFLYPRTGGVQYLTDEIAKSCGSITTNYEINRVWKDGGECFVSDSRSEKSFSKLVSTIPIPSLIGCLENVPSDVKKSAEGLKYNSLISVFIGMSVPKTKDFSWVYFPEDESLFHRASFPSNYSPGVVPEGHCSLLAEITCHVGDDIWSRTNEDIIENVVRRLDQLDIIDEESVVVTDAARMTPAYVIYDSEYEKNISVVEDYLETEGIVTCGRFGQFKYLNMDACIEKAVALAKELK